MTYGRADAKGRGQRGGRSPSKHSKAETRTNGLLFFLSFFLVLPENRDRITRLVLEDCNNLRALGKRGSTIRAYLIVQLLGRMFLSIRKKSAE